MKTEISYLLANPPYFSFPLLVSFGGKLLKLQLSARFHGPRNASGTGTGSGKMGSMLEIEQYYTVRVRVRVRDREVGVPDPVPDAMGPGPIASGNCIRVILFSICNPKSWNWSWKHFSDHVKPPLPGTPTSLIPDPDPDPDRGNEHLTHRRGVCIFLVIGKCSVVKPNTLLIFGESRRPSVN